ncbi:HAD-IIIC family phosphatase [Nonomuraea sp. KC401]|uniref:HAD-IIIC family phosphatase n=1 Tax=unclassified Nonomuraea TaxID=2593643 RepID=UPI0010FD8F44|nr:MULTISPECIES: HAD-IIIC family phosphatase [unclassified Nonomuraea]NBE97999.1 HAD-IIIC family phosphatase [Nonomuraea sp. K271]TLF61825.1 HAD-IIIC family phosphatase [Nonomuraea sp. KC401]
MTSVTARWRELQAADRDAVRVTVLAAFTVDTFVPHLGVALAELGVPAAFTVGPYNQIVRECVARDSMTSRSAPDILLVWPRLEELSPAGRHAPVPGGDGWSGPLLDVVEAALQAGTRLGAQVLFVLPAIPEVQPLGAGDASDPHGVSARATAAREAARAKLAEIPGTLVCDADDFVRAVGGRAAYDARLEKIARIPYSARLLSVAAAAIARTARLARQPARKVIVLDADGTLWGGAVGEVGADGVDVGPGPGEAFLDFQSYLLELREAGVLLALCSKNTEADVWAALARSDMRLRREHLSAARVGWESKPDSVAEITAELGVGLDAVVFVDDNPAEIAQMGAVLPEVATVRMPEDPVHWRAAVDVAALDRPPPTEDDRLRPARVVEARRRDRGQAADEQQWLATLDVRVRSRTALPSDVRRLAQLAMKTNQMNLNHRRLSERDVAAICASDEHRALVFDAADRFGDYGTVGALVLSLTAADTAELDLFVLSCRALGRGIEHAMLARAQAVAALTGRSRVSAVLEEHDRNEPARLLFRDRGSPGPGERFVLAPTGMPTHLSLVDDDGR